MLSHRILPLALLAFAASAPAQDGLPERGDAASDRAVPGSDDAERDHARAEFVEARGRFAAATAAALTSEELTNWARGLSARVRLRRAEEDLRATQEGLRSLEAAGRSDTEEAVRLAERVALLEVEIIRLRDPNAVPADAGLPDRETIRRWMENEIAEETARLADTLTTRELERRTRRLRRLARLAQTAGGFRQRRAAREPGIGVPSEVVPAGGTSPSDGDELGPATTSPPGVRPGRATPPADAELGPATTVPPELPEEPDATDKAEPPA